MDDLGEESGDLMMFASTCSIRLELLLPSSGKFS